MTRKTLWFPEGGVTLLESEIEEFYDGDIAVDSTDYDNATNRYNWADFLIDPYSIENANEGGYVELHLFYKLDGTSYGDGEDGDVAAPTPTPNSRHGIFNFENAAGQQLQQVLEVPLSPFAFRACIVNKAGQAMAASGHSVKMYPYNKEIQ